MKKFRQLFTGIIIGIILTLTTSVFAAGVIMKAEYNSNKVIFNGQELNLSSPLISVVDEATPQNATNYMPVRAVLEAMNYKVDWDGSKNSVIITSRIEEIEEALPLRQVMENLESKNVKSEIVFDESKQEVYLTKDSLKATIYFPPEGQLKARVVCGDKESSINLVIKELRTFINEKELLNALKEVGFLA